MHTCSGPAALACARAGRGDGFGEGAPALSLAVCKGRQAQEASMIPEFRIIPRPVGTVADILDAKGNAVFAVAPQDTVLWAVQEMNTREVGALLVMEGAHLVGIVSERDYTRKIALLGRSSRDTRVREIMTTRLHTVEPETSLGECMHIVNRHKVRHLPVLNGAGVVGVVSIGDLIAAVLSQQAETIERLSTMIGAAYPH
jgi:CBS domain-containing protein